MQAREPMLARLEEQVLAQSLMPAQQQLRR
jgi:hypothetical protein